MKAIIKGLKCDNPDCDWKNEEIPYEEYASWVNAPCPKCGAIVLTEKDYRIAAGMKIASESKLIRAVEKVAGCFGGKDSIYRVSMDGTGKYSTEKIDADEVKDMNLF